MPYIERAGRVAIDEALDAMPSLSHGALTYAITRLMVQYVEPQANYTRMSQARSSAHDAADEFYRRVVAPYEDEKRRTNGDVYDPIEAS